ncbi:MAG: hypothetical protein ACE5EX_11255 [Phycisphaerae bacterium]
MTRSVERIDGVKDARFGLKTGRALIHFEEGKTVSPQLLLDTIKKSGFTPLRVEMGKGSDEGTKRRSDGATEARRELGNEGVRDQGAEVHLSVMR